MKPEAGHRLYLKKDLVRRLKAEAKFLGISLDELIIIRLTKTECDSKAVVEQIKRLETTQNQLVRLITQYHEQ